MEGRYRAYPEYRDSGVEWLGDVPKNWKVTKLGYLVDTVVPMRDKPALTSGGIPWVRIEDFDGKYISDSKSNQGVSKKTIRDMHLKVFPVGAVLCSCSCNMGRTAIVAKELTSNQTFIGLIPGAEIKEDFLYYLMQASVSELTAKGSGAIQQYLSQEQFKSLRFAFPPYPEQQQIANFLDHETAKIDTLIEKQQQLIALLKEKRQAVISHAVTKGLNPDAPMKDSGVEWLGEVPGHWGVSRVKFHSLVKGRIGFRGYTVEDLVNENEGALVIGATEMTFSGSIELSSPQYISWEKYYESPEIMLEAGMILIVQRGSTVGKVAYVEDGLGKATINPSLIVLKNMEIEPRYLSFSLMESRIQNVVRMQTSSTAIPMISQEQVGNYYILIPPKEEQVDICTYIDNNAKAVETAINASNKSITLLQERRTALISAAVTGKIDVRNWQLPTDKDIQ